MEKLLEYLNALPPGLRKAFCGAIGTTEGYLRKAVSIGQPLRESLCINIERETRGAITCESLRSDVDWAYLRKTCKQKAA